jgi:hypothetical protein
MEEDNAQQSLSIAVAELAACMWASSGVKFVVSLNFCFFPDIIGLCSTQLPEQHAQPRMQQYNHNHKNFCAKCFLFGGLLLPPPMPSPQFFSQFRFERSWKHY